MLSFIEDNTSAAGRAKIKKRFFTNDRTQFLRYTILTSKHSPKSNNDVVANASISRQSTAYKHSRLNALSLNESKATDPLSGKTHLCNNKQTEDLPLIQSQTGSIDTFFPSQQGNVNNIEQIYTNPISTFNVNQYTESNNTYPSSTPSTVVGVSPFLLAGMQRNAANIASDIGTILSQLNQNSTTNQSNNGLLSTSDIPFQLNNHQINNYMYQPNNESLESSNNRLRQQLLRMLLPEG